MDYICEKFRNEKNRNMRNPFKYGTVVEGKFFTDRHKELENIQRQIDSENHLVLISPRRFGKTSLVVKAVKQSGRPSISINFQKLVSVTDFAATVLKELFKLHPWEKLKYEMSHFRVVPTISTNPMSDGVEVAFMPSVNANVALEDVFTLVDKLSSQDNKLIIVLDEFQEIMSLDKGVDKRLRAIMQEMGNVNFIILGSQESMMTEIFERKRSPFYHFGLLMHLSKIPYSDFHQYIEERMPATNRIDNSVIADQILSITSCHPYYTQQLSAQVWNILTYDLQDFGTNTEETGIVESAVRQLTEIHDLDFERIWQNLNNTDKRIMQTLCRGKRLVEGCSLPSSTVYSAIKKLIKAGYIIRTEGYELEDPFFRRWITDNRI